MITLSLSAAYAAAAHRATYFEASRETNQQNLISLNRYMMYKYILIGLVIELLFFNSCVGASKLGTEIYWKTVSKVEQITYEGK